MSSEQRYLDYRVRQHSKQAQNLAFKMGLTVASFIAICFTLVFFTPSNVLATVLFAGLAAGVTIFGFWTVALTTAMDTIDFVQRLNLERQEAINQT